MINASRLYLITNAHMIPVEQRHNLYPQLKANTFCFGVFSTLEATVIALLATEQATKLMQDQPIQLANSEAGVRWTIPLLQQGRSLVLLCACKDYEQCHRKLVFDVLTLCLADTVRPPQQMRYEPATDLYQGITTGGESRVSVVPDIFDWNRDLLDEELYDPNGWVREADGEHAWVAQLEVRI